jgi:hypothetical protein
MASMMLSIIHHFVEMALRIVRGGGAFVAL